MLGYSLVYTDGKELGSDEVIKLGSTDGELVFNIHVDLDIITLGIDVGTDLGSLDGSFDGSNVDKLGVSMGYTYGNTLALYL